MRFELTVTAVFISTLHTGQPPVTEEGVHREGQQGGGHGHHGEFES